ncbi:MAG: TIGR00730 family Rossman fold protein [Nesterenkonia sp.]|uniref:LOG family protein n=1 Tax=Nesterenkonia marinintestina TaxID=2979865 RepID=UPI0021C0F0F6|nr:TIGR00730 family Rossman fold protein [Nesterenkonia sp. GX14115]MDO5493887.1 TIGR00730 family Rossman fold protein [Nesterenkonia sp.]
MKRIAVFTGSRPGRDPAFAEAAADLGRRAAERGVGLVYGGGRVGLMGVVADAAADAGGEVVGVIPAHMGVAEDAHHGITRLEVVEDMHARKERMAALADGFVALPGGIGTLEELFEIWTWRQLGLHAKPVTLYDVDGFWRPLLTMIDHMVESGFLSPRTRDELQITTGPDRAIDCLLT